MKYDEFAFFNQQLAAMLRDGIPLEGALKRLCEDMHKSQLREELQALEADLARGTPIPEALQQRRLPELYKRMVMVGVKSGDLPGALTMLADYFQRQSNLWMRLKGLMVYPLIVLFVAFLVSSFIAILWTGVISPSLFAGFDGWGALPYATEFSLSILGHVWIFPLAFGLLFSFGISIVFIPGLRDQFRWRIPAFKEASVSRVAASLNLLIKNGVPLPEAIALVENLENNRQTLGDLQRWKKNIETGVAKFAEVASPSRTFPPMFIWTVANSGDDLAAGFNRAAEMYQARAIYRTEVALYSVLPVSALFLGMIVLTEAYLVVSMFLPLISYT